jgi:NAD(P)H dehydrogenase (quinone)
MTVYAVTGASGHLGRLTVQTLLACGVRPSDIVAVVRSRAAIADLVARGVQVRVADYSLPDTMRAALAAVDRLLLVSSSEAGHRIVHHTNVIDAAKEVRVSRILYTSMLKTDVASNRSPLITWPASSRSAKAAWSSRCWAMACIRRALPTICANTSPVGEILGATAAAESQRPREDFASAAATALLRDEGGNAVYELGGPSFDLAQLGRTISDVTGTRVAYRDWPVEEYVDVLQQGGLDEETARFVAAIDASIARGELETDLRDLAQLLGRPPTPLVELVRAAYDDLKVSHFVR